MALAHSPKIVTDGLVFAYDMGNTQKSWKGAPTTNLITNPTNEVIATGAEFAVFQDISPIFDANGAGVYSISADIKSAIPGNVTVYTASGDTEYNIGYFTAAANTLYNRFYFNNISITQTNPAVNFSNLSFYGVYGTGVFPSIKNVQIEKNSFCTQFVNGARSNTQAVVDLMGTNTITATSLTYQSDRTFSFNGSSNYIDSGPVALTGTSTQSLTWACWVSSAAANGDIINMVYPTAGWNMCPIYASGQIFYARVWSSGAMAADFSFVLNQYYYLVLTRNNATNTNSFYVNGRLVASQTGATYSSSGNANNHYFGRAGSQATNTHFNGKIPSGQIYTKALTEQEVQQNFNALRGRYGI